MKPTAAQLRNCAAWNEEQASRVLREAKCASNDERDYMYRYGTRLEAQAKDLWQQAKKRDDWNANFQISETTWTVAIKDNEK